MITVTSRPDDITSAYLPVNYVFTSDRSPNAESTEISTVQQIKSDPTQPSVDGFPALFVFTTPIANVSVGDFVQVSGSPASFGYDGIHQVLEVRTPNQFILDVIWTNSGSILSGGTASKFYRNFSIVVDLFIGGAFKARIRTQKDTANEFSFDFQRLIQGFLKEDLQASGTTTSDPVTDAAKQFYIKYAEEYDVPNSSGVPELTIQDFTDDVANTKFAVNTIINYVDLKDRTITSTSYNMSEFVLDGSNDRFLTNMPKTVTIGENESAQLFFMIDGSIFSPVTTISRRVITYDIAGNTLATTDTAIATGSGADNGYHIPVGTANITFASNVHKYEVMVRSSTTGIISEVITYVIDRECHKVERRFVWLNSRGGIDAFTFKGKDTIIEEVEKSEFKRLLNFPRVLPERTWTTIRNIPRTRYTTGSGQINNETREWVKEILRSPNVWMEISGDYLPVRILTDGYTVSNTFDRLQSVTLEWEFAFDEQAQRN